MNRRKLTSVRKRPVIDADAAAIDIPPEVFEGLVSAWADLLVADYHARHDGDAVTPKLAVCRIIRRG